MFTTYSKYNLTSSINSDIISHVGHKTYLCFCTGLCLEYISNKSERYDIMGGFFGVVSKTDAVSDAFFGTDYHSHLGTSRGGMAAYNKENGLQRKIHKIEN